jgi:hypothetical protein
LQPKRSQCQSRTFLTVALDGELGDINHPRFALLLHRNSEMKPCLYMLYSQWGAGMLQVSDHAPSWIVHIKALCIMENCYSTGKWKKVRSRSWSLATKVPFCTIGIVVSSTFERCLNRCLGPTWKVPGSQGTTSILEVPPTVPCRSEVQTPPGTHRCTGYLYDILYLWWVGNPRSKGTWVHELPWHPKKPWASATDTATRKVLCEVIALLPGTATSINACIIDESNKIKHVGER